MSINNPWLNPSSSDKPDGNESAIPLMLKTSDSSGCCTYPLQNYVFKAKVINREQQIQQNTLKHLEWDIAPDPSIRVSAALICAEHLREAGVLGDWKLRRFLLLVAALWSWSALLRWGRSLCSLRPCTRRRRFWLRPRACSERLKALIVNGFGTRRLVLPRIDFAMRSVPEVLREVLLGGRCQHVSAPHNSACEEEPAFPDIFLCSSLFQIGMRFCSAMSDCFWTRFTRIHTPNHPGSQTSSVVKKRSCPV